MKNILQVFTIISILAFPVFGNAAGLSNEEAKKIIGKDMGYPKLEHRILDFENNDSQEVIDYLFKNGYLQPAPHRPYTYNTYKYYDITQKGREILNRPGTASQDTAELTSGGTLRFYTFATFIKYIKEIKEILIDEKNIATVSYVIAYKVNEPFYSQVIAKSTLAKQGIVEKQSHELQEIRVKLKKYDKGWRVIQ